MVKPLKKPTGSSKVRKRRIQKLAISGLDSKTHGYILSYLRRIFQWHSGRKDAVKKATLPDGRSRCEMCHGPFEKSMTDVDHMDPVVSIEEGWTNWDDYINRLLCAADRLRVLCKPCHRNLTGQQNVARGVQRRTRKTSKTNTTPGVDVD